MQGYLSIVLHAHLPFVRHPEHEKFLEESWLFEAITEAQAELDSERPVAGELPARRPPADDLLSRFLDEKVGDDEEMVS